MDVLLPNLSSFPFWSKVSFLSLFVLAFQLSHSCISDASTAAVIVTQSPWIWATNLRRSAIRRHDAWLPLTATNTKVQSLQTASSATRLITHALPNPTTAISNARAVSYGTTTINGTSASWTVTYAATTPCVTDIISGKIV